MDAQDIINYVEYTPGNSNPNVLRSMLERMSGGTATLEDFFSPEELAIALRDQIERLNSEEMKEIIGEIWEKHQEP